MKTGGKAEFFAQPVRAADLQELLRWASGEGHQVTVIGGGSNILISDAGIRGLVIDMRMFKHMTVRGCLLTASAGNLLEKAVSSASEAGLSGLEVFSGLPGPLEGPSPATPGASGTKSVNPLFGSSTWILTEYTQGGQRGTPIRLQGIPVQTQSHDHSRSSLSARTCRTPYRDWQSKAVPAAAKRDGTVSKPLHGIGVQESTFSRRQAAAVRRQAHRGGWPSRFTHHKAQVADYHGNYIINPTGEATSQDIYDLVRIIQQRITEQTHIELEPEIRFLGEFAQHSAP